MEYSKVGKYYEVFSGYAFKSQDLKETADIPIIKIGNISNGRNVINENMQFVSKELLGINKKYYVNRGDVLLSLTGSHMNQPNSVVGRSCRNYSDRLYLLNQRAGKIVPKNNASLSYIYYVLQTQAMKEMICCRAYGAANQVNVSPKSIMSIKWNFPSSDVQHSIASILSTYDTLIENNTKRIRLLEKMAENLYKEWFVRFRFPGHENVEMENGLPKGWKVMHIKDIATLKSGFAFKSEWFVSEGCGVAKIKDIGETFMDLSNLSYVCEDNCKKAQRFILKEGMLTIALTGATIGKISIVPKHSTCIYTNQRLGKFFVENQPIDSLPFLYCLFSQESMVQDIINLANSSSAQPNISPEQINNIKFTCDEKIIDKYNQMLKGYFQIMIDLHCQNSLLARQRDLLLPRLMSGKLEVKVKA